MNAVGIYSHQVQELFGNCLPASAALLQNVLRSQLEALWQTFLKVHLNLPISSSSYEVNVFNISHKNTFYFLRYLYMRYLNDLFTNIQEQ